jgi:hypothetical protein
VIECINFDILIWKTVKVWVYFLCAKINEKSKFEIWHRYDNKDMSYIYIKVCYKKKKLNDFIKFYLMPLFKRSLIKSRLSEEKWREMKFNLLNLKHHKSFIVIELYAAHKIILFSISIPLPLSLLFVQMVL